MHSGQVRNLTPPGQNEKHSTINKLYSVIIFSYEDDKHLAVAHVHRLTRDVFFHIRAVCVCWQGASSKYCLKTWPDWFMYKTSVITFSHRDCREHLHSLIIVFIVRWNCTGNCRFYQWTTNAGMQKMFSGLNGLNMPWEPFSPSDLVTTQWSVYIPQRPRNMAMNLYKS